MPGTGDKLETVSRGESFYARELGCAAVTAQPKETVHAMRRKIGSWSKNTGL